VRTKIIVTLCLMVLVGGCGSPNDSELTNWGKSSSYFSFWTEQATIAQKAGLLNPTQTAAIDAAVTQGDLCLWEWRRHIDDPNYPAPNGALCINNAVQQMIINLPVKGDTK